MDDRQDYIIYKDDKGQHGYASESFYESYHGLLDDVEIVRVRVSDKRARNISEILNRLSNKHES